MENKEILMPEENYIELPDDDEEEFDTEDMGAEKEELPEDGEEEESEEDGAEEEKEPAGGAADERTVPLAALRQEREENKKLRDRLKNSEDIMSRLYSVTGARSPEELSGRMDDLEINAFKESRGIDDDTARLLLAQQRELRGFRQSESRRGFDDDIRNLAKEEGYDDAEDLRDNIEEYMRKTGSSAKEAYNALFAEDRTARLIEAALKNAAAEKKKKSSREIKGLTQQGNGASTVGGSLNLSKQELAAARKAGISPEEYAKYK